MKKAFVILLALAMLLSNALAQSVEVGGGVENPEALALSLNKVYITENWQGEENSTHAWIVLEVEITNYSTSVLPLDRQLSASLVYDSRYIFEAERHFELKEIEPLVQISGALVFKVPKMLTKAEPGLLHATLTLNEETYPMVLDTRTAAVPDIGIPDVYFDTPEEAVVYFAECVKNQNLLGALGATYVQPAAKDYNLAVMIERMGGYMPAAATAMWLPSEYEAYVPFNALTALDNKLLFSFITTLLAGGRPLAGPAPAQWDRNSGMFKEDGYALSGLTAEQMIQMLDPARLAGLKLKAVYRYESDQILQQNYHRGVLANGLTYSFSDCWDYLSVYELDGQCYVHTCTIVKYLRGWKILRLISNLLGNDLSSGVMPLEEYGAALTEPEYVLTWKDGSADPNKALKEVDTSPLIGRWKASTEDTMEFMEFMELREDKTCLVSQDGEAMEGVWNANSLCVVFGESVRSLKSCLYTLEGSKLTLTYNSEQYVFERT